MSQDHKIIHYIESIKSSTLYLPVLETFYLTLLKKEEIVNNRYIPYSWKCIIVIVLFFDIYFFYNLAFTSANHWIIVASLRCAQYQESVSKSCHNISKCEVYEVCKKHLPNCFAIYKIMDGKVKLNMAKCMECEPSSDRECIMKSFTETAVAPVVYFACCCSESECNKNIVFNQSLASLSKSPIAVSK